MDEPHIKNIYYSLGEKGAYSTNPATLKKAFLKKYPQSNISKEMISDFLSKQESYSLHRNARKNFPRNIVYVSGGNLQWCADLIDFLPFKKYNNGFRYILICVDSFTRVAHAEGLKKKTKQETLMAFKKIVKRAPLTPEVLTTDMGTEFINNEMKAYLKSKKIKFFISQGVKKNAICERFIRSIKDKLFRYFDANHTRKWIDILQPMIESYNETYHRSIDMAPNSVNFANEDQVYKKLYGKLPKKKEGKFKIGDTVRLRRYLRFVDKSYENRWSRAVYRISKGPFYTMKGSFPMYKISDIDTHKEVPGSYYEYDLLYIDQKTFLDDFIFPIEKRIRYRTKNGRREVYVKWLGYDSYGWIPVKSLDNIVQYK